ncbi:MAG: TIGR00366 family protein [Negativicutes bacterium]|nr:TIGR00366 family protein [Negativicutes bacterium]
MADAGSEIRPPKGGASNIVDKFTEWSLNWVPDSMVFVLILTFIVFVAALGLTKSSVFDLINWYAGSFWLLLTFAMQLCILMITGFVVADSKQVKRGIVAVLDWPKTAKSTIALYCLVGGAVAWVHWGVGLMFCMIMGRELAVRKRGLGIHYPFVAALAYSVTNVMCNGPSQSAPLLVATPGHFLEKMIGIIPLNETALSPFLIALQLFLFITLPLLAIWLMPKKERAVEMSDELYKEFTATLPEEDEKTLRPAERWDRSKILQSLLALGILAWVGNYIYTKGFGKLDLNSINFLFLGLALILHGSPRSFTESLKRGVTTTFGVMVQFPMYAGIFGMISNSGISAMITHWFVSISTAGTYSWIIYLYTGVMDFFVPSGGSKFVIEAPFILPAGQQLGVPVAQIINAYSTGAQWANNLQPFWALPVLAAFRVRFQDILPFTFAIWLYAGIVSSIFFLLFPNGL